LPPQLVRHAASSGMSSAILTADCTDIVAYWLNVDIPEDWLTGTPSKLMRLLPSGRTPRRMPAPLSHAIDRLNVDVDLGSVDADSVLVAKPAQVAQPMKGVWFWARKPVPEFVQTLLA
jgi:hypothetical protein